MADAPNAARKKRYSQMNSTGRTTAAGAVKLSILQPARLKVKAKAYRPARARSTYLFALVGAPVQRCACCRP
jgi:hypothetical protein